MPRTLTQFLIVAGVMLALGAPVFIVSWRRGLRDTIRNFLIGGAVVALLCGVLAGVSDRQVAQCEAAGNPDCIDAGATGLQLVLIGSYVTVAWITASLIYKR
jgi:hypothetical protein